MAKKKQNNFFLNKVSISSSSLHQLHAYKSPFEISPDISEITRYRQQINKNSKICYWSVCTVLLYTYIIVVTLQLSAAIRINAGS